MNKKIDKVREELKEELAITLFGLLISEKDMKDIEGMEFIIDKAFSRLKKELLE